MSVWLMPTVQILGCGQCETCTDLRWVHLHYLSHICGSYRVEKPQRSLPTQLLHAVDQWWFGLQYHGIYYCAWRVRQCQGLLTRSMHPQWFKHCTLKPISMHDNSPIHRERLVTEWFYEHECKVKYLSGPAQSPDLNINFVSHFGVFFESRILSLYCQKYKCQI